MDMTCDKLMEEIHKLLGRQAIGPPLTRQEEEWLDDCLAQLNRLATPSQTEYPDEEPPWPRSRTKPTYPQPEPSQEKPTKPVIRSGTKDFLMGVGTTLVCIPLLCVMMIGCCAAGRWLAEQLVLPEIPMICAAACIIPGVLLLLVAKDAARWLDRTLLSYDEDEL